MTHSVSLKSSPSTSLIELTISDAIEGLKSKSFSAVELTQAHIDRQQETHSLNAYVTETPELALNQAKESDTRIQAGTSRPLEGIPLAIKDLFCTKGVRTTASSRILDNFIPPYESTITTQLWNAGAVMMGKTSLDEFAMGSSNLTSAFGPVINPWKGKSGKNLVPGGSSGGSASAVAALSAMGATATDTGGSIRQPASFCGLVGMKPTYGRCSRYGVIAFASSLDQAGPITRTVRDAALMLQYMAGHDPKDATSVNTPVPEYSKALDRPIKGLRIGIPQEYHMAGMDPCMEELWTQGKEWFKAQGAELVEISLPYTKQALATYYIIAPAEASSNLSRYDGVRFGHRVEGSNLNELYENTRGEGFGLEVKRRIMIGTYVLSHGYYDAYYLQAQKIRALILQDFKNAFEKVDVILTPSTPTAAFAIGEEPKDPVTMYLNDVFTVTTNLAGLPAISVPAGLSNDGLPLSLQVIGRAFDEETVLRAGKVIEDAALFPTLKAS